MSDRQDPRASGRSQRPRPLSYKFQRLREQIRSAVLNGEFQGRLPGERELGRLYNANAKTINKALSDLSAEGLLVRRIGKGTFVAGRNGDVADRLAARRIHILTPAVCNGGASPQTLPSHLAARLRDQGHEVFIQAISQTESGGEIPVETMREAETVIWLSPEPLTHSRDGLDPSGLLELMRRQIPLIAIGAFGEGPRRNVVVADYVDAGFRLAQHLVLAGSRRLAVLGPPEAGREFELLCQGCRTAAARYRVAVERLSLVRDAESYALPHRDTVFNPADGNGGAWPLGLICAGLHAAMAMVDEKAGGGPALLRRVIPACVIEPGHKLCERFDLTSYDVAIDDLVDQAVRLAGSARAGDVPLEIAVPGGIELRGSLSAARLRPPDRAATVPVMSGQRAIQSSGTA